MSTEDKSQMPLFSPEDEREAQKELESLRKRLRENENGVFNVNTVNRKRTGFEDKTLWDKLNLFGTLAIPVVVALATIAFGLIQFNLANQQHENDQKIANQQHQQDQQSALDQQQATILQTYIDNIQDLLLHDNLRGSKVGDEGEILARARTLTALQGLDPDRKGRLVQFIYEAQLIGFLDIGKNNQHEPIIDLTEANLSDANLRGAILPDATLSNVDLRGATLTNANLRGATLSGAKLGGADLSGTKLVFAYLHLADLTNATLSNVDLTDANLSDVSLTNANLYGADLYGADLSEANLIGTDLTVAQNLTQHQLDQVFTCNGAILPLGLTCHVNQ